MHEFLPSYKLFLTIYHDNGTETFPVSNWEKMAQLIVSIILNMDESIEEFKKKILKWHKSASLSNCDFDMNQIPPNNFNEMIDIWYKIVSNDSSYKLPISPSENEIFTVLQNMLDTPEGTFPYVYFYDGRYGKRKWKQYFDVFYKIGSDKTGFGKNLYPRNKTMLTYTLDEEKPIIRTEYNKYFFRNREDAEKALRILNSL